jgi:hypothetical protein
MDSSASDAAIDDQRLAGDESGLFAEQESH